MEKMTRRDAVGIAALAGTFAVAQLIANPAQAAEKPIGEQDEQAERKRVIDCGLTEAEADCWILVSKAAAKFFELPVLHPTDGQEVAQAIHVVQQKLLSRPAYRKYKELVSKQGK